jgi:hypothetical protein
MTSGDNERNLVRLYLLGQLAEEEKERLEVQFMTNPAFQEEVLIGEEELIEEYLGESLSTEDRERFTTHLLCTPQQRERLEVARALDRYCNNNSAADATAEEIELPESVPVRSATLAGVPFFKQPIVAYSAAAALLVGVLVGTWLILNRSRQPDVGRQLALLNSPQGRDRKPDRQEPLSPVVVRGGESTKEISQTRADLVELLLALPPDVHSRYRATLSGGNLATPYAINDLEATVSSAGRQVPVRIRTTQLAPGDYFLELEGLTDGAFESIADYSFRVSN